MNAYPAGDAAQAEFAKLRAYAREEGRDPASIGVEVWVSAGAGRRGELARGIQVLEERRRHPRHAQWRL